MGDTNKNYLSFKTNFVYFILLLSIWLPSKAVANDENVNYGDSNIVSQLVTFYEQLGELSLLSIVLDSGFIIPENITAQCRNDVHYFFESLLSSQHGGPYALWTLRGIDAFGKIPAGLMEGDINSLGRYHECIDIEIFKNTSNKNASPDFVGKYCIAFIVIVDDQGKSIYPAHPKLGICFPSTCDYEDITKIINYFTAMTSLRFVVMNQYCQVKEPEPWKISTMFAMSVFSFLFCLVFIGTLKDIGNNWHEKIPNEKLKDKTKTKALFGKMEPFILAFSARQNLSKILTVNDNANEMSCLHGYRFLATTWVIVVHIFVMGVQDYPWKNAVRASQTIGNNFFTQAITSAVLSPDCFFVMAGLLVTYHTFDQMKKFGGKFNLLVFYLHRYIRLTPAYAANLLFIIGIYKHVGEGPLWPFIYESSDRCSTCWWKNLLYIQNLWGSFYDQCFLPSWYLAMDFQMYLVAPLFMIPLYRKPKFGLLLIGTAFVINIIVPGILIYIYDMESYTGRNSRADNMDLWTNMIYSKPWNRMSTYFIGMILGYIFHTRGLKIKVPKKLVWLGWIASTVIICSIVFGPYKYFLGNHMTRAGYAFYGALSRPLWGLSMAWIIFACVIGNGGVVNSFLSWKAFVPLSRLSYCIYLVHILVVHSMFYSQYDGMYATWSALINTTISMTVLAMFYALILSLLTEAPMMQIEKMLLVKYLPNKEKENKKSNNSLLVDSKESEKYEKQSVILAQNVNDTNGYSVSATGGNARRRFQ